METNEPMTALTSCPLCGGEVHQIRRSRKIAVGKRKVTVDDEQTWCDSCQEGFYLPGQLDALEARIAEQIRLKEGLRSPEKIKAIRDRYFLTQEEFERLLGVGPKTVVRWEHGGAFPSAAVNTLLDVIDNCEQTARYLAKKNGVTIVAPPPISTAEFQVVTVGETKVREESTPEYRQVGNAGTVLVLVVSKDSVGWDEEQLFGSGPRANDRTFH